MNFLPPQKEGACCTHAPSPKLYFNASQTNSGIKVAQVRDLTPLVCSNAPTKPPDELWVLTRPIGTTDPIWGEQCTITGTPEHIRSLFDLSAGVPWPWRLLKNKKAKRFLRDARKEEVRYRRDQLAREKVGEN